MNMTSILEAVWHALNSPAGIAAVAGLILWALNRLYAKKPAWKQYEESKPDPDDVKNRGNRPQTQPGNDPQGDNDGGDR